MRRTRDEGVDLASGHHHVRVMVKLTPSVEEARALADPRIAVGTGGWVTLNFGFADVPDEEMLCAWVIESYRALCPKTLVRQLDARTS